MLKLDKKTMWLCIPYVWKYCVWRGEGNMFRLFKLCKHFLFRDKLYTTAEGPPMDPPLPPNMFMENFDNTAITTFRRPP